MEVKPAAGGDWRPARPLLALRAGDVVRTTEDASAVVLLSGGRGTVRVAGAAGTLTVPGVAAAGQGQKAKALVDASLGFLAGTTKESSQAVLATRSMARPPVILSPRNGPVLPEALAFEWLGSRFARYTVRLVGPSGPVVERREVTGPRWEYPADAPALAPNVRYTLQVTAGGQPAQEAWFEVVDAARARAVADDLTTLDQELGAAVPPTSQAVMRAGLLAREGLLHDARRVVIAALDGTATSRRSTCCWGISTPAPASPPSPPNPSTRPSSSSRSKPSPPRGGEGRVRGWRKRADATARPRPGPSRAGGAAGSRRTPP